MIDRKLVTNDILEAAKKTMNDILETEDDKLLQVEELKATLHILEHWHDAMHFRIKKIQSGLSETERKEIYAKNFRETWEDVAHIWYANNTKTD